MKRVYVLGAGFSRGVSEEMPLTDQLGNLIRRRSPDVAARTRGEFTGGYFESWLSRLAESQPDLTEEVNLANRSLFLRITDELHSIIQEKQAVAMREACPWWLHKFIGIVHADEATLITFNYDTLVESTVDLRQIYDWEARQRVYSPHVIRHLPPPPPYPPRYAYDPAETFRLLKLHGSLDSYWAPGDSSGATINRMPAAGEWGEPFIPAERERRQVLPGRSPFIVPPAAAKSAFYGNPISRELWRSASEALEAADSVGIIGYSLPSVDVVASGMFADRVASRPGVRVEVVNPCPDEVVDRLHRLGVADQQIRVVEGGDAVERYVDGLEVERGSRVIESLRGADASRSLLLAVSETAAARVTAIERRGADVWLRISDTGTAGSVTQMMPGAVRPTKTMGELQEVLQCSDSGLNVRYVDGATSRVLSLATWDSSTGLGDGHWAVLVPCAFPLQG
jgi:hypothetical protein